MSVALRGLKRSEATRAKMSASHRGKPQSEAARAKISAAQALRAEAGTLRSYRCKTGELNGVHWQGSYELAFLKSCLANGVAVERGKRRAYSGVDGSRHFYVPDFVLPDFDGVNVECKSDHILARDIRKMAAAVRANPSLRLVVITKEWLAIDRWLPLIREAQAGRRLTICPYAEGPARIESFAEAHGTATIVAQAPAATTYNSCRSQALPGESANSYSTEVSIGKGV